MAKKTILTKDISPEQIAKHKKRKDDFEIIQMFCECWYESLNESSISYQRAIEEITDMIGRNIEEGRVTESIGWKLIGEYAVKCRRVVSTGRYNGVPSAFVKLLKESKDKLPNPIRDNKHANDESISMSENVSIYERHSARLKEYGVIVSPSTLKRWFDTIPQKS